MTDDTPPTRKTHRVLLEEEQKRHGETRELLNQAHAENMRLKAEISAATDEAAATKLRLGERIIELEAQLAAERTAREKCDAAQKGWAAARERAERAERGRDALHAASNRQPDSSTSAESSSSLVKSHGEPPVCTECGGSHDVDSGSFCPPRAEAAQPALNRAFRDAWLELNAHETEFSGKATRYALAWAERDGRDLRAQLAAERAAREKAEGRVAAVLEALRMPLDSEDEARIVSGLVERADAAEGALERLTALVENSGAADVTRKLIEAEQWLAQPKPEGASTPGGET